MLISQKNKKIEEKYFCEITPELHSHHKKCDDNIFDVPHNLWVFSLLVILYTKNGILNIWASLFISSNIQILIHCGPFIESLIKK